VKCHTKDFSCSILGNGSGISVVLPLLRIIISLVLALFKTRLLFFTQLAIYAPIRMVNGHPGMDSLDMTNIQMISEQ
ncbi:MAG: hypothetical protein WAX04_11440, partial [Oscillospiraceae bacterium]